MARTQAIPEVYDPPQPEDVFPSPVGPFVQLAIGVDGLNRVWMLVEDEGSGTKRLVVMNGSTGEILEVRTFSYDLLGRGFPDQYGRMWFSNIGNLGLSAFSVDTFEQVVEIPDFSDGLYDFSTRGAIQIIHSAYSTPLIYVVGFKAESFAPNLGGLRIFRIYNIPGAEGISGWSNEIASPGPVAPLWSFSGAGDLYFTNPNRQGTVFFSDPSPSDIYEMVLSDSNDAGIVSIVTAFGYTWLGGDSTFLGAAPAQLQAVDTSVNPGLGNVRRTFTFAGAIKIPDVYYDDNFVYALVVRQVAGAPAVANSVVKIDPVRLEVVSDTPLDTAGAFTSPAFLMTHNSTLFSYPSSVLADSWVWGELGRRTGDLAPSPSPAYGGLTPADGWQSRTQQFQYLAGRGSPPGAMNRYFAVLLGPAPRTVFRGRSTWAFGASGAGVPEFRIVNAPSILEPEIGTFLHDGTGMTVVLVVHATNDDASPLLRTVTAYPMLAGNVGIAVSYEGTELRVRMGDGVGFSVDAITSGAAFDRNRTHVVAIRYSDTETPKLQITRVSQYSGAGVLGQPTGPYEQVLSDDTGTAPSLSAPDREPLLGVSLGYMPEFTLHRSYLSDYETRELVRSLAAKWLGPYVPGDSPDQELWLRGDDADIVQVATTDTDVPSRGTGPGQTVVVGNYFNIPRTFKKPPGDVDAPQLAPLGYRGLTALSFDRSLPTRLEAVDQAPLEFRWLHGGGKANGGLLDGMSLSWVMRMANVAGVHTLFSTGAAISTDIGFQILWNQASQLISISSSNGGAYVINFDSSAIAPLIPGATYRCHLAANFSGGANTFVAATTAKLLVRGGGVDGSVTQALAQVPVDSDPVGTLRIGGKTGAATPNASGLIGEVAGYRRALTLQEVEDLDHYLRRRWDDAYP